MSDAEARRSDVCVGCGKPTDCPGGVVCWTCFKYRYNPLKYFNGSFEAWQRTLPELKLVDIPASSITEPGDWKD